jgi:hypothetical protein
VVATLVTAAVVPLIYAVVVTSAAAVVGVSTAGMVVPGDVEISVPATDVVGAASPAVVVTTIVLVTFLGDEPDLGGGQAG